MTTSQGYYYYIIIIIVYALQGSRSGTDRPNLDTGTVRCLEYSDRVMISLGIDELIASSGRLRGRRVGLVANAASLDGSFRDTASRLASEPGITLAALFGPQHGFRVTAQDNMIETPHETTGRQRLPVYSLYSETREPTAEMLRDLDALVIDLPDVGTRVYTFIYTMANCLRAARRHDLPVIVCDRPNPIGGEAIEGPVLEPEYASFVGQFSIPLRHGLTMGELARLFNDGFGIGATLDVVRMRGWQRSMYFDATGLPWAMPSPNIPTLDTALAYAGAVLFEGTNLSEGRGTTRPFELIGAPWLDAESLADSLNRAGLPGVHARPSRFQPTFQKHAGMACGGCQLHVTDRHSFAPVRTAVTILATVRRANRERFAWRQPPYEYEATKVPIDILAGTAALRRQIEADAPPGEIAQTWEQGLSEFRRLRADFLLY